MQHTIAMAFVFYATTVCNNTIDMRALYVYDKIEFRRFYENKSTFAVSKHT